MSGLYGEESETVIVYDYPADKVSVYTTRTGVKDNILERADDAARVTKTHSNDGRVVAWNLEVDMDAARDAYMFTKA